MPHSVLSNRIPESGCQGAEKEKGCRIPAPAFLKTYFLSSSLACQCCLLTQLAPCKRFLSVFTDHQRVSQEVWLLSTHFLQLGASLTTQGVHILEEFRMELLVHTTPSATSLEATVSVTLWKHLRRYQVYDVAQFPVAKKKKWFCSKQIKIQTGNSKPTRG